MFYAVHFNKRSNFRSEQTTIGDLKLPGFYLYFPSFQLVANDVRIERFVD